MDNCKTIKTFGLHFENEIKCCIYCSFKQTKNILLIDFIAENHSNNLKLVIDWTRRRP